MLRLKQSGRFSDVITNMNSGNSQQKASSRSWMIKYGIRRYYNLTFASKCPDCGQVLTRVYRRHPFVMPKQFGKGLWLTADCRCVRAEQKMLREQLERINVKPELSLPLPPALRNHTFANFQVESFNRQAYSVCRKFAANFVKVTDGKGLILCGKSGRGKTHLACAIINAIKDQHSTAFAHIPTLLEQLRQGKGNLEQLIGVDLLVLDDLGSERNQTGRWRSC